MKKWTALTLAAVMAASMAGCGGGTDAGTTAAPAADTTAADTAAESTEAAADDTEAADAASDKVYQIATDITFKPFEFENENGEMVGIDLDLLKAIAEDQGFTYELQVVGFNAAVMAMETGAADAVIAGMSITPE